MRFSLHHHNLASEVPSHERLTRPFEHHDDSSYSVEKIVGVIVGVILLCGVIGAVMACLRRPGRGMRGSLRQVPRGVTF